MEGIEMQLNPKMTFEKVGADILVLDGTATSVMSITGERAHVVRQLLDSRQVGSNDDGVDELVRLGVILPGASNAVSRRSLVAAGAAIGASGVVALGLPAAANASSQVQLPSPSFDFLGGIVLSSVFTIEGVDPNFSIDFLEFDASRLLNASVYPPGFVLEWSLTATSGFDQEFEFQDLGGGDLRYDWLGSVAAGSNYDDEEELLTVFIRARFGTAVSESVEVQWQDDD